MSNGNLKVNVSRSKFLLQVIPLILDDCYRTDIEKENMGIKFIFKLHVHLIKYYYLNAAYC